MIRRPGFIPLIIILTYGIGQAQKQSAKTFTITYKTERTESSPERMTSFYSDVRTSVKGVVDDSDINTMSQKFLVVPGSFVSRVANDKIGRQDWSVWLEVDELNILAGADKTEISPTPDDELIRYTASARIIIKEAAGGKLVFERSLANVGEEHSITRGELHLLRGIAQGVDTNKKKAVFYSLASQAHDVLQHAYWDTRETIYVSIFSVKGKAYGEVQDAQEKVFDAYSKFHALSKKNRIPKADVDAVFRSVIPVWEKASADASLEGKAKKGMLLNCAVAYTWLGEFDKARTYLDQVPETSTATAIEGEPAIDPSSVAPGTTIFLAFEQSAEGARKLYTTFRKVFPFMTIEQ